MKNLSNLRSDLLSKEELAAARGGDAPIDPIIIKSSTMLSASTEDSAFPNQPAVLSTLNLPEQAKLPF